MGLKVSKQGPGQDEDITVQHHLINYISTSCYIRNMVSKQRRRMLVAGYDLDMSYITDRVLAMSFPAERMRAMFRNPLWQVKSVLDMTHQGHYKVHIFNPDSSIISPHFCLLGKCWHYTTDRVLSVNIMFLWWNLADLQPLYRRNLWSIKFWWPSGIISIWWQPCSPSRNDQDFLWKCTFMAIKGSKKYCGCTLHGNSCKLAISIWKRIRLFVIFSISCSFHFPHICFW